MQSRHQLLLHLRHLQRRTKLGLAWQPVRSSSRAARHSITRTSAARCTKSKGTAPVRRQGPGRTDSREALVGEAAPGLARASAGAPPGSACGALGCRGAGPGVSTPRKRATWLRERNLPITAGSLSVPLAAAQSTSSCSVKAKHPGSSQSTANKVVSHLVPSAV